MEILVFLLVISNLNLVLGEDVAIENSASPKDGYSVHSEQENKDLLNDQLAESSQSIGQAYGNAVVSDSIKQIQDETPGQVQPSQKLTDADVGQLQLQNDFRHSSLVLSPIQVLQSDPHQGYAQPQQPQGQLYVHQYPIQQVQVFDAEALPLQQTHENEDAQALGYSSYVEHLSEKDEDEIKSALKEGSVSDIKRLVPKSGISFKIYHSEKNSENQNSETPHTHSTSNSPAAVSRLHHRIRNEVPAPFHKIQTDVYQTPTLEELQPTSPKNEDGGHRNSQQLLQYHRQDQQGVNVQAVYYPQPEPHKTVVEVNSKSSAFVKPHFKINVAENNYNGQTTSGEGYQNLKYSAKSSKPSFSDGNNQKQWNFGGKAEVGLRAVKPAKSVEALHYGAEPLAQTEGGKGLPYAPNLGNSAVGYNFNKQRVENSLQTGNHGSSNYLSNSYKTGQNHFGPQLANVVHSEQKVVLNRLSGNYVNAEGIKQGQVIGHLGTNAYAEHNFKGGRFAVTDSETAKSNQHGVISQVPKTSYIETKNSQTFDHQKALEGSTSFDIKNAIDSSGSLIHQTETHPLEGVPKQQFTYLIPEIPTSTVVIDNSIHDAATKGHQIENFGHSPIQPQLSYHAEAPGKFYHPPQNLLWTSEQFKQGTAFAPKDLHQQLLRLHLPKEEVFVKAPNLEFPTSVVSHVSVPQQKQPFAFHYDLPFVKSFPQELHFQPKTKTRLQPNPPHLKLTHPVTLDWSLFKSGLPNFGMNTVEVKHELPSHVQEPGKKIIPILVRKRKNRSNGKEIGVIYGKVTGNRRPVKPNQHRQEKNVRVNLTPEGIVSTKKQFETKGERKNEFSVSASYKVDRSSKSS